VQIYEPPGNVWRLNFSPIFPKSYDAAPPKFDNCHKIRHITTHNVGPRMPKR